MQIGEELVEDSVEVAGLQRRVVSYYRYETSSSIGGAVISDARSLGGESGGGKSGAKTGDVVIALKNRPGQHYISGNIVANGDIYIDSDLLTESNTGLLGGFDGHVRQGLQGTAEVRLPTPTDQSSPAVKRSAVPVPSAGCPNRLNTPSLAELKTTRRPPSGVQAYVRSEPASEVTLVSVSRSRSQTPVQARDYIPGYKPRL